MVILLYVMMILLSISAQLPLFMLKETINRKIKKLDRKLNRKEILYISGLILFNAGVTDILIFLFSGHMSVLVAPFIGIVLVFFSVWVLEKI